MSRITKYPDAQAILQDALFSNITIPLETISYVENQSRLGLI